MTEKQTFSIKADARKKALVEHAAQFIFTVCAFFAVMAVLSITVYMFLNGTPALFEVGITDLLFGTVWKPTAKEPSFGILYVILTSILGTSAAVVIGAPIGVFTAVFIEEIAGKKMAAIVKPAVELLAGIPSVIYGLLGIYLLNPLMYKLERLVFAGSTTHQYTGGANLLSAVIVLAIMILPTVIGVSESALRAVPQSYYEGALALGATHERAVFFAVLPAAKSGILAGVVLGVGRAIGETMAVIMVAGNQPRMPAGLFKGVRTLTANIVMEMGYASGLHREALIATGVVLFVFILLINLCFSLLKRRMD